MAEFVIRVGSRSATGLRANNEDRYVADPEHHVFLVADGMGGQEAGEKASGLAAEIIPRVLQDRLARETADQAVKLALAEANQAIIAAGADQRAGRRMGTTAVLAVHKDDQVYVAGLGDSRAYLIRGDRVEQLTIDHTIADALERNGTLTPEQAKNSPWKNILYKFLGCVEMSESAEVAFPRRRPAIACCSPAASGVKGRLIFLDAAAFFHGLIWLCNVARPFKASAMVCR